jgi:hypothetical protein
MKMAWAEDTMTYPMLVNNYRITSQPDSSRDTTPYRIDFTIQDNAAEKNIYYMQTWVDAKIPVYDSLSRDTVLKDFSFFISSYSRKSSNVFFLNNGFLYLYDDNFNGSSKDIHLIFKSLGIPANATDVYVNTLFRNARPAYHLYWRSLANYFNGNNNVFSQPRLVYTNLHDGYGYFAATNPNFQRIRLR